MKSAKVEYCIDGYQSIEVPVHSMEDLLLHLIRPELTGVLSSQAGCERFQGGASDQRTMCG